MNKTVFSWLLLLATAVFFQACRDEDPPLPENEPELVTTVELQFTNTADPSDQVTALFSDPDGIGGNPPVRFDTIRLGAGKTYHCQVTLSDASKNPPHDLTHEVEEEADDHQFYYLPSGVEVVITYEDVDSKGRPLGLHTLWQCGAASSGTVTVILKHKPGLKGDNDPPTVGDTDMELAFRTELQ
ncbi:MAG: hypothetical protein RMK52_06905 [Chitinophagales bacterium]|nr:hypothetical protein [Chitinophagales bacterium]MDW8393958.1 hypothetical protein [Chitinophagales bacterium]